MEGENSQTVLTTDMQINSVWVMVSTAFIFFMEAGFFLLEGGSLRKKNIGHVLLKNIMSASVAMLMWWFTGYGFAFGPVSNHFIAGDGHFFASSRFENYEVDHYLAFIF
jgi:Amt family ammonium transporter